MRRRVTTWCFWGGAAVVACSAAVMLLAWASSVEVQRINPYDEIRRELTGRIGTEEGSPIRAVILDRNVLIERENDIPAIDPGRHYPLQLRTVVYFGLWVAAGGAVLLGCGAVGRRFVRR